jgi:chromosome segregation ATPase
MLKSWKLWTTVGALGLAISSIGFSTFWSYVRTFWRATGQTIREQVPLDFEIERLSTLIDGAENELRRNEQALARLEVEVEYLQKDIQQVEADISRQKAEMAKLRDALRDEGRETFEFGGKTYTRKQVENDLARRLNRLESTEKILATKRETLEKRMQALEENRTAIGQVRIHIERLAQKRDELKELKRLQDMQPDVAVTMDASKLQEATRLANEIEKELRSRQKMRENANAPGQIPVELDDRPLLERVDEALKK